MQIHQTTTDRVPRPRRGWAVPVCTLAALTALTGCGADGEETSPLLDPSSSASSGGSGSREDSPTTSPSASPTESVSTRAERWRDNFLDDQQIYRRAVERRVVSAAPVAAITATALQSCNALVARRALPRRLNQVAAGFADVATITPQGSLAFLDLTTAYVCPDQQATHETQVAAAARAARAEARRERRREQREAPDPAPVFYENCSDVEAAGAAPIYAGDPGYSTDLDRDGDGVACET